ncbi:MAG: hypothetical protein KBC02_02235 [Candidatus Pacebacteria bacterium]|nr:hypothetical protein [Candidatus Paceibacterota bacterium]
MIITTVKYATPIGSIVGIIWAFALGGGLFKGILIGGLAGCMLGIIMGLFAVASTKGGRVIPGEAMVVNGSIIGMFGMVFSILGMATWIVRRVFFS